MLIAKLEGTGVYGLGLKSCREKCENGRGKQYNRLMTASGSDQVRSHCQPCMCTSIKSPATTTLFRRARQTRKLMQHNSF